MDTLRPGARGGDVSLLCERLAERGISVPASEVRESFYGPGLVAAVQDFQAKYHLAVDGIVGPCTWTALDRPADTSPKLAGALVLPADLPEIVSSALVIADAACRKPVVEEPFGSNRGPEVDLYLLGHDHDGEWLLNLLGEGKGAPWCGRFAKWCFDEAAASRGKPSPVAGWGDLASAAKWLAEAERRGLSSATPTVGAVGCTSTGGHGHVVLVAEVINGVVETREGNSANRCIARLRKPEEFARFVKVT